MVNSSWTCPSCSLGITSAFCPDCGEVRPKLRDLTLRGLADQVFVAFSSIGSRLLRSLRTPLIAPGALTVAYLNGQRMPYLRPVPLSSASIQSAFATWETPRASAAGYTRCACMSGPAIACTSNSTGASSGFSSAAVTSPRNPATSCGQSGF
ncbi:MAG: DUF3667 domain-containing protein [Gammaproteobacteria bacterium]